MNLLKKIISLISAAAIVFSLAAVNIQAEDETLCDAVGITESLSNKIIKFDGNRYGAAPTLIDNYQIVPLGDSIGIFSNPSNNDYKVFATAARVALVGGNKNDDRNNTTSKGYKITITSSDKTSGLNGDDTVVGGNWVKAEKTGAETIWIPIVDSYIAQYDSDIGSKATMNLPNANAAVSHEGSVGGRAFDDNASVFRTTDWPGKARFSFAAPNCVCTYEVSVYAPNEGTAIIYGDNSSVQPDKLVSFTGGKFGTGYLKYDTAPWSGMKTYDSQAWHRVAVTFDPMRGQRWLYVDGELISNALGFNNPALYKNVEFGIRDAALGGFVAYDDFVLSYGFYNPSANNVELKSDANITVEDNTLNYNPSNIGTVSAFIDSVKAISNASDVKLYTDETLSAAPAELALAKIAVLASPNGATRNVYNIASNTSETDMQKIGLSVGTEYTKGFYTHKNNSKVSNLYVKATQDSIAVFNLDNQNEYSAYGWRVLETLTSSTGYTLSIWDAAKTVEKSVANEYKDGIYYGTRNVDMVTDGDWLKAEKAGEEAIWIPIIGKLNVMEDTSLTTAAIGSWQALVTKSGLGGKASDDSSIALPTTGNLQIGATPGGTTVDSYVPYTTGGIYTWAFNVFADDSEVYDIRTVNQAGQHTVFLKVNADGTFTYANAGADVNGGVLAKNQWHRIVIILDPVRNSMQLYVDGKCLTLSATVPSVNPSTIKYIRVTSTVAGILAVDDVKVYNGFYDYKEDSVDIHASDITVDNGKVFCKSTSDLKAQLENLETVSSAAVDGDTAIAVSNSGLGYNYLSVEQSAQKIVFDKSKAGKVIAQTLYTPNENEVLYIAEYDENGALVSVDINEANENDTYASVSLNTESANIKAFLWDDMVPECNAANVE